MKRRFTPSSSPVCIAAAITAVFLLADAPLVKSLVGEGLSLCLNAVIPSLFPFAVITELIFFDGRGIVFPHFVQRALHSVFGISEGLASAFITGTITGFPMGTTAISKIYSAGGCTKEEAEYAAALSGMPSPAFIVGAVGTAVFSSVHAGVFLLLIQLLSMFPVSVLLRTALRRKTSSDTPSVPQSGHTKFRLSALSTAVKNAGTNMLAICSCVVFFTVISGYALRHAGALGQESGIFGAVVSGFFEMTAGTSKLGGTHILRALPCAAALIGFGGLSIACQVSLVCEKSGMSIKPFLLSRIYFAFFNFVFTLAAEYFLPFAVPTFGSDIVKALTPKYECVGAVPYFRYAFLFSVAMLAAKLLPPVVSAIAKRFSEKKNAAQNGGKKA